MRRIRGRQHLSLKEEGKNRALFPACHNLSARSRVAASRSKSTKRHHKLQSTNNPRK